MAIKKLQNDCTTPEQSKRLLELGVPADSANHVYDCSLIGGEKYYSLSFLEDELFSVYKRRWEDSSTDIIPCWSVGRLIEIMTICYKWDLLSCASFRIYVTDIVGHNLINQLINDLSLEISRGDIDFSKLEE